MIRMSSTDRMPALVLTVATLLSGCGDEPVVPGMQDVKSHENAGVLRVSLADMVGSGELDVPTFATPTSRIAGGKEPLFGVVAAFGLPSESGEEIAVADRGSSSIRIFGAIGSEVRRLGGSGDGPGEFRGLVAGGRLGPDSIWAFDFLAKRITVFGPAETVRTVRLDSRFPIRTLFGHLEREFVAIESFVTTATTESGLHRDSVGIAVVSANDGRVRPFGRFSGSEVLFEVKSRTNSLSVAKSLISEGYKTLHAVLDGYLATVRTETYRLELRGPDGRLARVVEGNVRGRRIDSEYHDRAPVLADLVAGVSRDGLPVAWLRLATTAEDSLATWIAHGPDGGVVDGARLPADLRLTDVTADRFIGVEIDDLGVERVAVFER